VPKVNVKVGSAPPQTLELPAGCSILDLARAHELPVDGLCGGVMDCSTCHVIVDPLWAGLLPPPTEDEEDMLDLIPDSVPTSRLGCQVRITDALDGLALAIPLKTPFQ
jgi:ferredoxin